MPVKIIHHLLNVGGSHKQEKKRKEVDREVMQVYRKDVCERKTAHLHILDGGSSGLHRGSDKLDWGSYLILNSPYSPKCLSVVCFIQVPGSPSLHIPSRLYSLFLSLVHLSRVSVVLSSQAMSSCFNHICGISILPHFTSSLTVQCVMCHKLAA